MVSEAMNHLFEFKDYRKFIRALTTTQFHYTQASLSKAMNCQAAYLSQVLKERADLTEDHGIKLCEFLELSPLESEYFLILLRIGRAGTPNLRTFLEKRRQKLTEENQEIISRISATPKNQVNEATLYYCSSWIPALLHSATSCARLQSIDAIADRFSLPKQQVEMHLKLLKEYSLVNFEDGKWIFQGGSIHIPKNSALDQFFQFQRRIYSLGNLPKRNGSDVHFSNVLSINSKTAKEIRRQIVDLIDKIHQSAECSPSDDVYSFCLDFFQA